MSFTPVLPMAGYAGWTFLKRTQDAQKAAFEKSSDLQRDEGYFRAKIGSVTTAEQLVSDKRLLRVALGAFGLDADIRNTHFLKRVLQDGTLDRSDLANKLADKQYAAFSSAFGFGNYSVPRTQLSDFPDKILSAYRTRRFETAVGEQNGDLRLAMNAERELATLARKTGSDDAKWYTILGSTPLRKVFETAFGLPASFAAIDLDQQLSTLKEKATKTLGDGKVSQFQDTSKMDRLIRQFLLRSELAAGSSGSSGSAAAALQLLSSGPSSRNSSLRQ